MRLPSVRLSVDWLELISMPFPRLPESRFPVIVANDPSVFRMFAPPTVLPLELLIVIPSCELATAREPSALVPRRLPITRFPS